MKDEPKTKINISPDKLAQQIMDLVAKTDWEIDSCGITLNRYSSGEIEIYKVVSPYAKKRKVENVLDINLPDRPYEMDIAGSVSTIKST